MLKGLFQDEARDLILSVGTHRSKRRLSPVEVAELFQKAQESGETKKSCADFVNLTTTTMVTHFLGLLELSDKIRHIVDWGQSGSTLSFATARLLAKLDKIEQEVAAREILANGMNKDEVLQVVQIRKRAGTPIEQCINDVLRMRPIIIRKYLFMGAVTSDELKQQLSTMLQADRDDILQEAIQVAFGPLPNASVRLGPESFTVVTDQGGSEKISNSVSSDFEAKINEVLVKEVLHS